jgi:Ni/Co efflux regulator RcnB
MSLKLWFRAGATAVLSLALSTTIAVAQGNGHGHDKHDRDDDDREEHGHGRGHEDHGRGHEDHGRGHGHEGYRDHDRDIHDWYRTHYNHLPPGLAKRDRLPPGLERQLIVNGTLPPGLRGHMQPCPHELEVMLPPPPPNYAHVFIGGNLVLVNRVSFQVADVFHFDATF